MAETPRTEIDWSGNWDEIIPLIEKVVATGEMLEINLPRKVWERLRDRRRELSSRLTPLAASRLQLLWTPDGRNILFVDNGIFRGA